MVIGKKTRRARANSHTKKKAMITEATKVVSAWAITPNLDPVAYKTESVLTQSTSKYDGLKLRTQSVTINLV